MDKKPPCSADPLLFLLTLIIAVLCIHLISLVLTVTMNAWKKSREIQYPWLGKAEAHTPGDLGRVCKHLGGYCFKLLFLDITAIKPPLLYVSLVHAPPPSQGYAFGIQLPEHIFSPTGNYGM